MKKKQWIIAGGVLTVLLLIGVVGAAVVHAQTPTPPTAPGTSGTQTSPDGRGGPGWAGKFGFGGDHLDQAELNAAAKALNMTATDLSAQLQSGKTLAQIASAQSVDLQTVLQAIQAARPIRLGGTELDAAAKALGMTSTDLSTELQSGKTLSDIATEKGVNLQTVEDAMKAARRTEMTTQINQAVTDGQMSQDKANWLLEGLNKGYLDGPGPFGFDFGFGFGPRGPHMPGGPQLQVAPTATP